MSRMHYEIVPGFFLQDDPRANPATIGPIPPSFGLLSKVPSDWLEFQDRISDLNSAAPAHTSYKVLILGRHGQGYHNAAVLKYGRKEWDEKWSLLDGDGEMVWGPDADLTLLGQNQARELGAAWQMELSRGMPLPQRFYCSPMTRALHTCKLTFERILPDDHVGPVVLENLREWYGKNPCDKRSARSVITARFPSVEFDGDFTEEDTLWTHERESRAHVNERVGTVLDKVFSASKDDVYISITAHGGFFRALTDIIGRGEYALPPGGILPVVVKSSPKEGVY